MSALSLKADKSGRSAFVPEADIRSKLKRPFASRERDQKATADKKDDPVQR